MKKSKKSASSNGTPRAPLRDPDLQPQEVVLSHTVTVVLRTIHHSSHQMKAPSIEETTGVAYKRDPLFGPIYDAESCVDVTVDEREVAAIVNLQSGAGIVDSEHRRAKHYIESHLANVIEQSVVKLCNEARDLSALSRKELISRGLKEEEAAIRRRLPPEHETSWDWTEKAIGTLREMSHQEEKLTATNLAKRLFPVSGNALQDLRRKFKQAPYPMNFNELLLYANLHPLQLASPVPTEQVDTPENSVH